MAEYTQLFSGLGWGTTFEMNAKKPLIAKRSFPTLEDAYGYVNDLTATGTACPGLIIAVTADENKKNNGIYWIKSIGTADADGKLISGELVSAGSGAGSEAVDTYADAIEAATADNIGQIIYVKTTTYKKGDEYTTNPEEADVNEKGEKIEFTAGPYVVTGAGAVAKLGTTSASGDIAGDVETLKGAVSTLQAESIKGIKVDGTSLAVAEDKTVDLTNTLSVFAKSADLVAPLEKLAKIEDNAEVNIIESISVAGNALEVTDKAVSITFDAVYDASTTSENALQHKAIATVIEDLRGKISEIPKFRIEVVETLPKEGELAVVYLVKETGEETNNLYEEYVWTGSAFELLGRQELDLTDYITSSELAEELKPYATTTEVENTLKSYVTDASLKADYLDASTLNGMFEEKVDKVEGFSLVSDTSIELISTNASAIADLKLADASIDERLLEVEENAVFEVSIDASRQGVNYVTGSVADNTLSLAVTVGDCSTGKDGFATVSDVTTYVNKTVNDSIADALTWLDA